LANALRTGVLIATFGDAPEHRNMFVDARRELPATLDILPGTIDKVIPPARIRQGGVTRPVQLDCE
jgi:hypothetical protein